MTKIPDDKTIYRDGKPVTDRPRDEVLEILVNHVKDAEHPDYKPGDATVRAALCFTSIVFFEKREAGLKRAQQLKEAADNAAKPIYDKYKKLAATGVPKHKLISKTAAWAQQSAVQNGPDVRQIRRAVTRMWKKDTS